MKIIFILLILFFIGCGSNNPKSEKDVIIDPRTKLMWQDNLASETDTMNWNQAIEYCNNLNLANFQNWKLPSRSLLEAVYREESIFSFGASDLYWSSSSYASDSSYAWSVLFEYGYAYTYHNTELFYVRCVRDTQ